MARSRGSKGVDDSYQPGRCHPQITYKPRRLESRVSADKMHTTLPPDSRKRFPHHPQDFPQLHQIWGLTLPTSYAYAVQSCIGFNTNGNSPTTITRASERD
jgi:hypothetical protein